MSRIRQPLPEYASLVRWTVQEVINWLAENKLSDCSKYFREGGVDGNKLVNIAETDLINIHCPKKYIRDILNHVSMVARPGVPPRSGGRGNRGNQRQVPFNETNHFQDDGSGSDDGGWDEDEFSDYDDDDNASSESYESPVEPSTPKAPPRPNRREVPATPREAAPLPSSKRQPNHRQPPPRPEPEEEEFYEEPEDTVDVPERRGAPRLPGRPPVPDARGRPPVPVPDQDSPDEDYEDPDANLKVSNFHGGPLPTPPTHENKPKPIAQRKPPPLPETTRKPPDIPSEPDEEYEDPDSTVAARGPPLPTGPRKPPPRPAEPEEEYEEPDITVAKKAAQKSGGHRKPPAPPVSVPTSHSVRKQHPVQEEEYEDPDETVANNQKKPQPPPLSKIPRKTSAPVNELPAYEMPEEENAPPPVPRNVPRKKSHEPKIQQEEVYEVPDETDSTPQRSIPQKQQKIMPKQEEEVYEVPDSEEEQDDYLDMDPDITGPPIKQSPVKQSPQDYLDLTEDNITIPTMKQGLVTSGSRGSPEKGPRRAAMPLPNESKSHTTKRATDRKAPVEEQETYVEPDEEEEVKAPQKKKMGIPVLPGLVSNGVKENTLSLPTRSVRTLPPPPAVTPEKKEPEKKEPSKPVPVPHSTSTPHKAELTESDLLRQKWYHGNIKRVDAEVKLKQLSIDGMYLIRKSSQGSDQPYTLQIFYKGKCYNLPIRRRSDKLFAVGKEEKENERAFSSLLDLVNTFKQNILLLSGGAETKLVKSLPKT